jgi:hypothetical protein
MIPESQIVEVAIIGAGKHIPLHQSDFMRILKLTGSQGWYGLVAARTYLRLRPEVNLLIIDSDKTVGGVWSADRLYPNLVAQVKHGLFNYTDTPMSKDGA